MAKGHFFSSHLSRDDVIYFYLTSPKNSPGFIYTKWKDGKPLVTAMKKNSWLQYSIHPQITKYLKESDKCQKESYYECVASQLDANIFNECSEKCIPNAFSNLNKTYRKPFCQNDIENEHCALRIISNMQEQENGSECKKSCFNLKYHGQVVIYEKDQEIQEWGNLQNWDEYYFKYYLANQDFVSEVNEEYLIYDAIAMIGSVGGTLGI